MKEMLEIVAGVSGVGTVLMQVPGLPIPEDLKTWPITAILGLITLTSIVAMVFVFRHSYKVMSDNHKAKENTAVALTRLADAQASFVLGMAEYNKKQGAANENMSNLITKLEARPCLAKEMVEAMKMYESQKQGEGK